MSIPIEKDERLTVALIQSHLFWENPTGNRKLFEEKIEAISKPVDLIVLPEMFTTGFTMTPDHIPATDGEATLLWMQRMSGMKQAAIMGSTVFHEAGKWYNRMLFVFPDGSFTSYDKKHTFTLAGEHEVYENGTEKGLISYKGFKIRPLICYDLRFPVWARNVDDYDLLVVVANWPKPRITAWDTLLKARAIENMAYCIGVNRVGIDGTGLEYVGHSAVYDTLGAELCFTTTESIEFATLTKSHIEGTRGKLRFLNDRDSFNLVQ